MGAKQFVLHSKLMAEMYPASLLSINMRAICYTGNILHNQMFKIFNQRTHNTSLYNIMSQPLKSCSGGWVISCIGKTFLDRTCINNKK